MMNRLRNNTLTLLLTVLLLTALAAGAQDRRVTPVTPAVPTAPAPKPEAQTKRPPRHVAETHDERGNIVLVDTVTGLEYVDSTAVRKIPRMEYPLLSDIAVGVDIWDAAMRIFGQKYGLGSVWGSAGFHNRYFATLTLGLGICDDTPSGSNFTFKTPMAPFFKIGAQYNFFYNNSSNYQLLAGLAYGFSPFKWEVTDVTLDSPYWDEEARFGIPRQSASAGWVEVSLGIRVKIVKNFSMGWTFKYQALAHEGGSREYGEPLYVPGFGKRTSHVSGGFNLIYKFAVKQKESECQQSQ